MKEKFEARCIHGDPAASLQEENRAISFPIYQTASFSHIKLGHNDTIAGFICSKDPEMAQKIRLLSKTTGGVLAPFDSWLVMRGIKTLEVRMERQQQNAKRPRTGC